MTPAKLRNTLISALRAANFTVEEKENTPGAKKVWMKSKTIFDNIKLAEYVKTIVPEQQVISFPSGEIRGRDFELERQGAYQIFIACYDYDKRGLEYSMGVDC